MTRGYNVLVPVLLGLGFSGPVRAGTTEGLAAFKRGDYDTAMREYRPLADQGDPAAQVAVGWLYDNALGVLHDDAEAAKWYLRAAEQGNPIAQGYLGTMYAEGDGVPRSFTEAEKWFRRAAQQGDAGGQYGLGVMYRDGVVVERNLVNAYKWFRLSAIAETGEDRQALVALSALAEQMSAEDIRKAEELVKTWKPALE